MQDSSSKNWLDQLEVTDSIKGIMDFVDELSRNYDRRVAALHIDYQKDVEDILACYKQEKQEFATQVAEQQALIADLKKQIDVLESSYKTMSIEYKLTKDSLETARNELSILSKTLQKEDQLINLAHERIRVVNEQLKEDLSIRGVEAAESTQYAPLTAHTEMITDPVPRPKIRFKRTREFFVQVIADRLTRPIILRPKKQEPVILPDEQVKDSDEYSF